MKGKGNGFLDDELEFKIIKYFENHGVYKMASMEALLREVGMLNRDHRRANPMDHIHQVIDELLEDD